MKTKNLLSSYFSAWQQKFDNLTSLYTAQVYCVAYLEFVRSNHQLWLVLLLFFLAILAPYIAKLFELFFSIIFILLNMISPKKIEQKATEKTEREFRYSPSVMLSASIFYILILSILNVIEEKNASMIIGIGFLVLYPLINLINVVYIIIETYYEEYKLKKIIKKKH